MALVVVLLAAGVPLVVPMVMTLVKPMVMMPMVMLPMVGASIEEKRVINNQREDTKEEPGG